ncbi:MULTISPECIES: STAS domain-containing protein [unclassified Streptomyces]|uniref:STAS domain-containing protein n=1 Tax=Streptomyces sp. SYP-A7185 TaxID=3040076 RepID=UPI0038F5D415
MYQHHDLFRIEQRFDTTAAVVELHGEFDVLPAERLTLCLRNLAKCPQRDLIVDLRPATFIDASLLGVLCDAHEALRRDGRRLKVVATRPMTLRILRLCRLDHEFQILATLPVPDGLAATIGANGSPGPRL